MSRATRDIPPPLELLCLKALWALKEGSVKDVRSAVAEARPLAYTTIMTVLERLVRKGKLKRRKSGRAFLYTTAEPRDTLRHAAIRELLDGFFDGSEEELFRFLERPRSPAPTASEPEPVTAGDHIDTVLL